MFLWRACANLKDSFELHGDVAGINRTDDPLRARGLTVLYSYRLKRKHLVGCESIAAHLRRWMDERAPPNSVLILKEHGDLSIPDAINLYSQVDIIFGPFGSGFALGFLGPPGGVGIELAIRGRTMTKYQGLNVNDKRDYGSMYKAMRGGHHLSLLFPMEDNRVDRDQLSSPVPLLRHCLEIALCLKDQARAGVVGMEKQAQLCPWRDDAADAAVAEHHYDFDGIQLRRTIRANLPDHLVSSHPRLADLYFRAPKLGSSFQPVRGPQHKTSATGGGANMTLLLGFHCPTTSRSTSSASSPTLEQIIELEVRILKEYISKRASIHIVVDSPACSQNRDINETRLGARYNHTVDFEDFTSGRTEYLGVWSKDLIPTSKEFRTGRNLKIPVYANADHVRLALIDRDFKPTNSGFSDFLLIDKLDTEVGNLIALG